MLPRLLLLAAASLGAAETLPITGLAHVAFRVSDLEKARQFYTGVLGYEEAFRAGPAVYFKINDEQFVVLLPGLPPDQDVRLSHVAIQTPDLKKLRRMLDSRGLPPGAVETGPDGNPRFSIPDPDGTRLEFVEYVANSAVVRSRGKFLGARRLSDHLWHTGVTVANLDSAMAFYRDKLAFVETWRGGPSDAEIRWINMRMPGPRGDYVEFMLHSAPPTRPQLGSMHHLCLEVPEIQAAYNKAVEHGTPDQDRFKPRVGRNKRRLMNLFDPDGTRTELMEPKTVE